MKFLQDYIGDLFNCNAGCVRLSFEQDSRIQRRVDVMTQKAKYSVGAPEIILASIEFVSDTPDLQECNGSLRQEHKREHEEGLFDYKYKLLYGKETTTVFQYALGYQE